MKLTISENTLRGIIRKHISEALRYDKDAKRYFPKYTGDPHRDAGKFAANNRGDIEYSHNDYEWSNPENQRRFEKLQFKNNFEPNYTDREKDNEDEADSYLYQREPYNVIDKAAEELRGEFETLISNFIDYASNKYPIFKQDYYMSDLMYKLKEILDEYDYYNH